MNKGNKGGICCVLTNSLSYRVAELASVRLQGKAGRRRRTPSALIVQLHNIPPLQDRADLLTIHHISTCIM